MVLPTVADGATAGSPTGRGSAAAALLFGDSLCGSMSGCGHAMPPGLAAAGAGASPGAAICAGADFCESCVDADLWGLWSDILRGKPSRSALSRAADACSRPSARVFTIIHIVKLRRT
jgi:hypothetical protein